MTSYLGHFFLPLHILRVLGTLLEVRPPAVGRPPPRRRHRLLQLLLAHRRPRLERHPLLPRRLTLQGRLVGKTPDGWLGGWKKSAFSLSWHE